MLAPLPANQIRVLFYEGAGSFGNGCVAFDTAESAAIMSKAVGTPVRLQFMRWDEHGWTHYGPAILYDMRAGVDANGNMVAYEATGFSQGGTSLYTGRELLGAGPGSPIRSGQRPPDLGRGQRHRLGEPLAVDERREHELQVDQQADRLDDGHLPERPAPGAGRTADGVRRRADDGHARGRREHGPARLPPPEHADRLDRTSAGRRSSRRRQPRRTGSRGSPARTSSKGNIVTGRGIANGHHGGAYAAVVADITVNKKSGKITVDHLYAAQDSGFAVNPDLIYNQMVGNLIQATSRALCEEVTFNKNQVTSIDWVTYPILRFADAPQVTTRPRPADSTSRRSARASRSPARASARSRTRSSTRRARASTRPVDAGPRPATLKAAGIS